VPISDRLQMLNADDLAKPPRGSDLLDLPGIGRIAHHVTDREQLAAGLRGGNDPAAVLRIRRHRLLKQDVITQPGEADGRLRVQGVGRGHDHGIGEPGALGRVPPVREDVSGWDAVPVGKLHPAMLARVSNAHNLHLVGMSKGVLRVTGASYAGADNNQGDRGHGRTCDTASQRTWYPASSTRGTPAVETCMSGSSRSE